MVLNSLMSQFKFGHVEITGAETIFRDRMSPPGAKQARLFKQKIIKCFNFKRRFDLLVAILEMRVFNSRWNDVCFLNEGVGVCREFNVFICLFSGEGIIVAQR